MNVSQAELDLFRAENDAKASHARLSAAMGYDRDQPFSLADEPLPPPLDPDVDALIAQALRERPDLAALSSVAMLWIVLRRPRSSFATRPSPRPPWPASRRCATTRLPETYSAAGVNVNIPVLNGGLFKARREEAESRAAAADKDVEDSVAPDCARCAGRLAGRQRCLPAGWM